MTDVLKDGWLDGSMMDESIDRGWIVKLMDKYNISHDTDCSIREV